MANTQNNHGKAWTPAHVAALLQLAAGNTPTRLIGLKLGRTETAVQAKAQDLQLSLKPTNQAPYNRVKK